jgi:hypothetical protein
VFAVDSEKKSPVVDHDVELNTFHLFVGEIVKIIPL